MSQLTTHVLDTSAGRPAQGLKVALRDAGGATIAEAHTNADGRLDRPLLEGPSMRAGVFELRFHVGDYFRSTGVAVEQPAFLDLVPVRFGIVDPGMHHHVPLLVSPYGYTTYRGS